MVLYEDLTALHPSIRPFNYPSSNRGHKSRLSGRCLVLLRGFGRPFKLDLLHDLRIHLLQFLSQMLWMIAMIQQDRHLRNVHWFRPKVVNVVSQHLNQPRIVGQIRARAVREEGKA